MEPTVALRSIEVALRLVIGDVLGEDEWLHARGAPDEDRLADRRAEEEARRDGAITSRRLLDYAETHHLSTLIEKNWEKFQPVFKDRSRTLAYLGVAGDVRNSIAHSRELVPFERDLVSGIAGQLRNQVTIFRSSVDGSSRYYPLIESVTDSFGTEGGGRDFLQIGARIEVGDVLTFTGMAFNAKDNLVKWQIMPLTELVFYTVDDAVIDVGEGDSVTFDYVVTESNVSESLGVTVRITTDSRYHRYMSSTHEPFDDRRTFGYAVNPPHEV